MSRPRGTGFETRAYKDVFAIGVAGALVAILTVACDKSALLGPQNSTITVIAASRTLALNGSTTISATVLENSGSPVPNGTTVRFTTNLGSVSPAEAQTSNGVATTTFFAGDTSGIADVRAFSGLAKSTTTTGTGTGTGTGTATTGSDVVQISIGAAAVETITVRANPSSVSPSGSTVDIIANVVGLNGRAISGVLVTFSATAGSLSSSTAITDSNGEARTRLTTNVATTVSASAGAKTSTAPASIVVRAAAGLTLAVTPAAPVAGQPISLSVTPAAGTAPRVSVNWGDGTSEDLGVVAAARAVAHTYSAGGSYTIVATATSDGESFATSTGVVVAARQPLAVNVAAVDNTTGVGPQTWSFTATVTPAGAGGADSVERYDWDFGDGSSTMTSGNQTSHVYTCTGQRNVSVTARTTDGRTATGRTQINVDNTNTNCPS